MSLGAFVFWAAAALLGYTYLGYPLLLAAWARGRLRAAPRQDLWPSVSLLVVAHDESGRVEGRLRNLLSLDYPRDRTDLMLASDGSTDDTVARARAFEPEGVRVLAFSVRRGKPAVLSETVPLARGEIVVLADARQRFEPGALRALVAPFADPRVGAVSGELLLDADGARSFGQGVGLYWRYEKWIRATEARVDSTVGSTGAIYAIRRELFEPIPDDTILDDVLIPMRIVRRGYRVLFEPLARAHDRAVESRDEFRRKVRTLAGNFQLFAREPWLLDPRHNRLWLQTVSHKALRLLTPFLLLAALAGSMFLEPPVLARLALTAQAEFYAAALVGHVLRHRRMKTPVTTVPYVVCVLAVATLVALARFVTGRQAVTWDKDRGTGVKTEIPSAELS